MTARTAVARAWTATTGRLGLRARRLRADPWVPLRIAAVAVACAALDGWIGLAIGAVVGVEATTGSGRRLAGAGALCFVAVLVWDLARGLPTTETVSPLWVLDNPGAQHLAFAGFACLVAGLVATGAAGRPAVGADDVTIEPLDVEPVMAELEPDTPPGVRGSHVVRGSFWLFGILGLQSLGGVVFLSLAAHKASDDVVGLATALFTGLQYVNYASSLGIDVALARFGATRGVQSDRLFGWSAVVSAIGSVVATIAYLGVVSGKATALVSSPGGWCMFAVLAAGTAVYNLVDVRLMAARRWRWMLAKVVVISGLRLVLVLVDIHGHEAVWLFALLAGPMAVAGLLGVALLPAADAGSARLGRPDDVGPFVRFAGVNWVAALAFNAPQYTLPVIVAHYVTESRFANFYVAWSFALPVFFIPMAIHQVLLVEGAKDEEEERSRRRSREAMGLAGGLSLLAFLASLPLARLITTIYGPEYQEAVHLLPLILVGAIPWAISTIRLAEARLRKDTFSTVLITVTFGVGIVVLALVLVPGQRIDGAIRAWLVGNASVAAISLAVGTLRGRSRRRVAPVTPRP